MNVIYRALAACFGLAAVAIGLPALAADAARRPNVVFLIADDLGYGDLGSFGQTKIRTPHLDRLAKDGMRLVRHYSGNAVCAPSRCVLMTGKHPGHAFIRNNRSTPPEGQWPIPDDTVTLAELFKQLGYATGGFGKWGLGGPTSDGRPSRQGFDRFFGFNCQGVAHNHYPTYLWDNDEKVPLNNSPFASKQTLPPDADPNDPASYAGFTGRDYSMDLITQQAVKFVRDHRDEPFFLYYPTIIPHLALQAPADALAEYEGAFPEEPYVGGRGYLPHRTPRAAYAAMISRMDRHVGQIIQQVADLGLTEETIFVFTSDNGPLYDKLAGTDEEFFQSAGELRGRKGSLYEGGIRVPTIISWKGKIAAGTSSDRVTAFEDWLPTLLELVGAKEQTPAEIDGISFAASVRGESQPARPFLYREFPAYGGQQMVRIGDWKGVRQNLLPRGRNAQPNLTIELYDLKSDPHETKDVAAEHPDVIKKIEKVMRDEHTPSADFPFPPLDEAS
ncbi:MAG: arylsulfatase [Pirellulaceae bacterium]